MRNLAPSTVTTVDRFGPAASTTTETDDAPTASRDRHITRSLLLLEGRGYSAGFVGRRLNSQTQGAARSWTSRAPGATEAGRTGARSRSPSRQKASQCVRPLHGRPEGRMASVTAGPWFL